MYIDVFTGLVDISFSVTVRPRLREEWSTVVDLLEIRKITTFYRKDTISKLTPCMNWFIHSQSKIIINNPTLNEN